jgi:hypothetical protein
LDHPIHLSVVATSRNDNHGGYLTQRMQHFVDGFVAQCKRHNLRAELILVEWNPPADRVPLVEELCWPEDLGPCEIRIVTVPREMHGQLAHADRLPLFQMIAKNVGVRRARGRFVLATNIDILFSDESIVFMRDRLEPGCLYRADRLDVPTGLPAGVPFDELLRFCREKTFRIHTAGFTLVKKDGQWQPRSPLAGAAYGLWRAARRNVDELLGRDGAPMRSQASAGAVASAPAASAGRRSLARKVRALRKFLAWTWVTILGKRLFTNACGDFTLLSRADWDALRAYPEWPMYSWHLDSMLIYQARYSGMREVYLGKSAPVYHIEHSPGSGFTPESSDKLFERLQARGIPYLDWERDVEPKIEAMKAQLTRDGGAIFFNDDGWGFADHALGEARVGAAHGNRATA